jgi:hypothetical protein
MLEPDPAKRAKLIANALVTIVTARESLAEDMLLATRLTDHTSAVDMATLRGFQVVVAGMAMAEAALGSAFMETQDDFRDLRTFTPLTKDGVILRAHIVAGTSPQVPE